MMLFRCVKNALAFSFVLSLAASGQTPMRVAYNLDAARSAGLTVSVGTDKEFADLANPFLQNPRTRITVTDGMKPFTVLVKNTSGRAIAFIDVLYLRTRIDRTERPWNMRFGTTGKDRPALLPDEIAIIQPGIQTYGPGFALASPRSAQGASDEFETATSVIVNIDSVIFEDGTAYGPDVRGSVKRYEGERSAMGEVIGSLQKLKLEGFDKAIQYGQTLAALRPKGGFSVGGAFGDQAFWHDYKLQTIGMRVASLKSQADLEKVIASYAQAHSRLSPIRPKQ